MHVRLFFMHFLDPSLVDLALPSSLALVCCIVTWPAGHIIKDGGLESAPKPMVVEHGGNGSAGAAGACMDEVRETELAIGSGSVVL
jgi:hypothetical protein